MMIANCVALLRCQELMIMLLISYNTYNVAVVNMNAIFACILLKNILNFSNFCCELFSLCYSFIERCTACTSHMLFSQVSQYCSKAFEVCLVSAPNLCIESKAQQSKAEVKSPLLKSGLKFERSYTAAQSLFFANMRRGK